MSNAASGVGKKIVAGMIVAGLAAAIGSWWFHRSRQQRPLDYWGPATAELFLKAPLVELAVLRPGSVAVRVPEDSSGGGAGEHETLSAFGQSHIVERWLDIRQERGLAHVRNSFLNDVAYAWNEPRPTGCAREVRHALRFRDGDRSATVVFDYGCRRVAPPGAGPDVSFSPVIAGLKDIFEEYLCHAPPAAP